MTFQQAVNATPCLQNPDAYRTGLGALREEDREHLDIDETKHIGGSVDVDTALREAEPGANRWDYGIAYLHKGESAERIYWVETHTADDSQVEKVIRKAEWLRHWLKGKGIRLAGFTRRIVWVSSGATNFKRPLTVPRRKRMAAAGLEHVGSKLHIRHRQSS